MDSIDTGIIGSIPTASNTASIQTIPFLLIFILATLVYALCSVISRQLKLLLPSSTRTIEMQPGTGQTK